MNAKGKAKYISKCSLWLMWRIVCEECNGNRYKDEALDVKYQGKNISEVLEMTVTEAVEFFGGRRKTQLADQTDY